MSIRYLSLFSGIEAASVAWRPLGWTPVAFAEIEPFPCAVLAHHYPNVPNRGDVTKFKSWPDESVDLLCGGSPCQSFSVAGLRKGLADPRGNLALTFLAVAQRYRPRWVVWENVPGVHSSWSDAETHAATKENLAHVAAARRAVEQAGIELGADFGSGEFEECDQTSDFDCFLAGMEELGYGVATRVFDAQYFGVAQRRRRVFVVGYLGDWRRAAAVLFEPESLRGDSPPSREPRQGTAGTLSARTSGGGGLGTDFDLAGGVVAADVAPTLNAAFGQKLGLENQHIDSGGGSSLPSVANPLTARMHKGINTTLDEGQTLLPMRRGGFFDGPTHALKGEGFDGSEDGTGRGVPITLAIRGRNGEPSLEIRQDGTANAILTPNGGRAGIGVGAVAFDTTQITSKENRCNPQPGDPCHPLAAGGHPPAIAFDPMNQDSGEVAHTLRRGAGAGHDSIPVAFNWQAGGNQTTLGASPDTAATLSKSQTPAIAFSAKDSGTDAEVELSPTLRAGGHTGSHANGGIMPAVAFSGRDRGAEASVGRPEREPHAMIEHVGALETVKPWRVAANMAVRRLTPRECERLQGFPDDYTRIPVGKKFAADGPRYKALGNSWAVPCAAWIGRRIAIVDAIPKTQEAA